MHKTSLRNLRRSYKKSSKQVKRRIIDPILFVWAENPGGAGGHTATCRIVADGRWVAGFTLSAETTADQRVTFPVALGDGGDKLAYSLYLYTKGRDILW